MIPPPSDAVERFERDLEIVVGRALDGAKLTSDACLALAVSGGADSVAMLALAAKAFPDRIIAATFDHKLRTGSRDEAATVGKVCSRLAVPHTILEPAATIAGSSIQMRARDARYDALIAWAAAADVYPLLTAHHADDQAETLLMRLNRSSGVSGLAGIRAVRFAGGAMILRPLLRWRRNELREIAEYCGLPWIDDPSNADARHDRTRIRALLARNPELDPVALAASAAFITEADDALCRTADLIWSERWHGPDRAFSIDGLSRELRRRLVRRALSEARQAFVIILPTFAEGANIEPLLDAMATGRNAVHGGVIALREDDGWTFAPAPPRRAH